MFNPYQIDLGSDLYNALWNDPARPKELSVTEWAQAVLTAWLVAGKIEKEGGIQDAGVLVPEPKSSREQGNSPNDAQLIYAKNIRT